MTRDRVRHPINQGLQNHPPLDGDLVHRGGCRDFDFDSFQVSGAFKKFVCLMHLKAGKLDGFKIGLNQVLRIWP